jgi:hypothetical protein
METNKTNSKPIEGLVIVSSEILVSIEKSQNEIISLLKSKFNLGTESLDFVDEKKAIELMGRKATWFWQMRKSGALNYTKVGAKVYYSLSEIKKLIENGTSNNKNP